MEEKVETNAVNLVTWHTEKKKKKKKVEKKKVKKNEPVE